MNKKRLENHELKTIHGGQRVVAEVDIRRVCGGIFADLRFSVEIHVLVTDTVKSRTLADINRANITGKTCEL